MLEFGLEVYGGHGRACVCVWAWFFTGIGGSSISLSLSLRWWGLRDVECVYPRELEEGVECTCLCCQVHGEETRSLSVCRGCSLICFFNPALMIGMIYCQHSPAGRYAIILYRYMSFRLPYRCMFRSACRCFLMLRLVESRSELFNAQQERDASSSFR